jgi:hypothetical protein
MIHEEKLEVKNLVTLKFAILVQAPRLKMYFLYTQKGCKDRGRERYRINTPGISGYWGMGDGSWGGGGGEAAIFQRNSSRVVAWMVPWMVLFTYIFNPFPIFWGKHRSVP